MIAFGRMTLAFAVVIVFAPNDAPAQPPAAKTETVAGVCKDEHGKPLAGVEVALYREDLSAAKPERLHVATPADDGRFQFPDLPESPVNDDEPSWWYSVVATKPGRASATVSRMMATSRRELLSINLGPAATIQGRVADAANRPVVGVWVSGYTMATGRVDGVRSARTDAGGRYAISDLSPWEQNGNVKLPPGVQVAGPPQGVTFCFLNVDHPDFGRERPAYQAVPATVDVVLLPAGLIEGRVVDRVTGKPAAGVPVCLQSVAHAGKAWRRVFTDEDGTYRLTSLAADTVNIWADAPDRACVALDSFAVKAGKSHQAPDLTLVYGAWIEGRLVDNTTGKPFIRADDGSRVTIGVYGPARPRSGAAVQSCKVDDTGHFRIRVAPGMNYPYFMTPGLRERYAPRGRLDTGVEVQEGETARLELRILPIAK